MNNKTKKISILLFCCSLVLSGYTAVHAEVEPLVLPDDGPLDSPENQKIMNEAFERSNGAADAYTWDASGLNSYGYDPYALDYELSYLSDTALDAYQYNLDIFDGDPYTAYDQVAPEIDTYGWDDPDFLLPDDYWDGEGIIGDAEYDFSILGEEGDLLEQGLPEVAPKTFSEEIEAHIEERLNAPEADDIYPVYGEEPATSVMMDLPLTRIERDNIAISGAKDIDEAKKILYDMAAADGLDPSYVIQDEKVIVWDQLDNIMMGEGFLANEITHSVEEAYMKDDISLDTKTSIGEMIAEKPPEERFDFKGRVAEVQFGLGKPWDKGVYEKDGRLTHEYEVASTNSADWTGRYTPYLDTVVYSGAALDRRVQEKEELYDTVQGAHGIVIPEFEKARSEDRLREIEGASLRKHERDHVDNEIRDTARFSDMTTSDFFDGDAQRVGQALSKVQELEAYYASLAESEYPQMDLMYLEYAREIDRRNAAAQSPNVDHPSTDISASLVGNEFAREYSVTDILKASKFPEYMANQEASVLGDGYVTELESDIIRPKIEDGTYLNDPEYFPDRLIWMSTLPADQLRTRFKNTRDELADTIIPELPPKDDRY